MKFAPFPDQPLISLAEQAAYLQELLQYCMAMAQMSGYIGKILVPGDAGHDKDESDKECTAIVHTNYPYREFEISIQKKTIDKIMDALPGSDEWYAIERIILHEIIHVMIGRVSESLKRRFIAEDEAIEAEENLCDHIMIAIHANVMIARKYKGLSEGLVSTGNTQ